MDAPEDGCIARVLRSTGHRDTRPYLILSLWPFHSPEARELPHYAPQKKGDLTASEAGFVPLAPRGLQQNCGDGHHTAHTSASIQASPTLQLIVGVPTISNLQGSAGSGFSTPSAWSPANLRPPLRLWCTSQNGGERITLSCCSRYWASWPHLFFSQSGPTCLWFHFNGYVAVSISLQADMSCMHSFKVDLKSIC